MEQDVQEGQSVNICKRADKLSLNYYQALPSFPKRETPSLLKKIEQLFVQGHVTRNKELTNDKEIWVKFHYVNQLEEGFS